MKKILITGGNGMLASDFKKIVSGSYEIISYTRKDLDITSLVSLREKIEYDFPDIILNCAAYTAVDDAEDTGKKQNFDINTLGVAYIAQVCREKNIDFITLSTDYVFDGEKRDGYCEIDTPNPINSYGMAKYLGEKLAQQIYPSSIIIRTSWLFGGGKNHKNFVNTMLKLSENHSEINVINDQFGFPTYTSDLTLAILKLIQNIGENRGNIFHFSNSGENPITWFDFASKIFNIVGKDINLIPCSSNKFLSKAQRPKYSLIKNNSKIKLRNWQESLKDYLSKNIF